LGLRCWCEGGNVTVYAQVGDLSEGGLQLRMSVPLPQGETAVLRFQVGDSEEVCARARVVWRRNGGDGVPPGVGFEFQAVSHHVLSLIRQLLDGAAAGLCAPRLV
jgi:hypothetical protein